VRVRAATVAAAGLLAALLVNHWWVGTQFATIAAAGNIGVNLPGYLKFLVKLDHFAEDYGYLLVPLAWVAAFVVASIGFGLADLLRRPKLPAGTSDDWPADP
jgi:hypothetical protein